MPIQLNSKEIAYIETYKLLVARGVFAQCNASITLHFDAEGNLATIERKDNLYSKRHELLIPTSK